MCVTCFLIVFAEAFINVLANALALIILARVLLSWVPLRLPLGLGDLVFTVSETILAPIRRILWRVLPSMGGLDLSPLVAIIAIQALQTILVRLLPYPV
jgi:YggT family protein